MTIALPAGGSGAPAHVPASVTPGDPGRRPCTAGYPDPSGALIEIPATIMEGSPAPLPIALGGPAVVCVHPVPAGGVPSEAGSHHRGARARGPAIAADSDAL